jgi:RimJ/RimL family protein N-acetyltransferase
LFTTPRLVIEPLSAIHAEGLHAALAHPDVERFLHGPSPTTLDAMRARIAHLLAGPPPGLAGERWWNFAVRLGTEHTVIGQLEATTYGDWAEIAYVFGPQWWGQGLASEATAWLVRHLADRGAPELWAAVHPANAASQRLLLRLGFDRAAPARPLASLDPGDDTFVRRG